VTLYKKLEFVTLVGYITFSTFTGQSGNVDSIWNSKTNSGKRQKILDNSWDLSCSNNLYFLLIFIAIILRFFVKNDSCINFLYFNSVCRTDLMALDRSPDLFAYQFLCFISTFLLLCVAD